MTPKQAAIAAGYRAGVPLAIMAIRNKSSIQAVKATASKLRAAGIAIPMKQGGRRKVLDVPPDRLAEYRVLQSSGYRVAEIAAIMRLYRA